MFTDIDLKKKVIAVDCHTFFYSKVSCNNTQADIIGSFPPRYLSSIQFAPFYRHCYCILDDLTLDYNDVAPTDGTTVLLMTALTSSTLPHHQQLVYF